MKKRIITFVLFLWLLASASQAAEYNVADWGLSVESIDNAAVFNSRAKELPQGESHVIVVDAMYPTATTISFAKNNITLKGPGGFCASVENQSLLDVSKCNNLKLSGLTFDGSLLANRGVIIRTSDKVTVEYCTVKDIGNKESTGNKNGIALNACPDSKVTFCTVENIYTKPTAGASTGITLTDCINGRVTHNVIRNIGPVTDGDGIKFFTLGTDLYCEACDNVLVNCEKRGIKVQGNFVILRRNLIINAQHAGIDFQGSGSHHNKSLSDTVLVTDAAIDPYYGIAIWGTDNAVIGSHIIHAGRRDNRMQAIWIYAQTPDQITTLNNVHIRGAAIPVMVTATRGEGFLQPVKQLSVTNCKILDCRYAYAIQNGSYFSGGGPVFPIIQTVQFRNNTVTPADGKQFQGAVYNYTPADWLEKHPIK